MRRILVFLEILIPIWAISGDVFLAENVRQAKLENQKLAELIRQRLNESDIQPTNIQQPNVENFFRWTIPTAAVASGLMAT